MTSDPPVAQRAETVRTGAGARLFRSVFAVAVLFHLAGNPALAFGSRSPALGAVQAVVGLAAVACLFLQGREWPLLLLCGAVPISAWLEAPMVGNHWVLAAAVCLAYLSAAVIAAARRGRSDPVDTWAAFAPTGRLVLFLAYSFAAFSKLNSGFFDPRTSCAVFYQDQLVSSWGLPGLSVLGHGGIGRVVAAAAATVELSVPLLLLSRRTRRWGLVLALSFHYLLALDASQHFWDFSSVLFACFLLFLDEGQAAQLLAMARRPWASLRPASRLLLRAVGVAVATLATAAGVFGDRLTLQRAAVLSGHISWFVFGTAIVALVARTVLTTSSDEQRLLSIRTPWLLAVPALVILNGLSPYLELKTGFGWNMYSNLRTVAGGTNHFLVPATWDLTGLQRDRVEVLSSSDARLTAREHYEFVWSEFREYAHDNPGVTVRYRRGGTVYDAPTLAQDPASSGTVSPISRHLQSFRAVDTSGAERCLDVFGPAR